MGLIPLLICLITSIPFAVADDNQPLYTYYDEIDGIPAWDTAKKFLAVGTASISDDQEACFQKIHNQKPRLNLTWIHRLKVNVDLWDEMRVGISKIEGYKDTGVLEYRQILFWISGPKDLVGFTETKLTELDQQGFARFCYVSAAKKQNFYFVGDRMLAAFNRIYVPHLKERLREYRRLWDEDQSFALIFAGHSIGSCVAQMLALAAFSELGFPKDVVRFFGFGSPRCGDQNYNALILESDFANWRWYWANDSIRAYPIKNDVCQEEALPHFDNNRPPSKRCFIHAPDGIILGYEDGKKETFGCARDDWTCSHKYRDLGNREDHYKYFNVTNADYFSGHSCGVIQT